MAKRYYEVHNPTAADKSNSVHGSNSPYRKYGATEYWFLTYADGVSYMPSNGVQEQRSGEIAKYDGKSTSDSNKRPDPFTKEALRQRGHDLVEEFWDSLDIAIADRVTMHDDIDTGLHILELGDFSAGRYAINAVSTDSVFTASIKTALLSDIDAVLDDYPHLKTT